ncbi:MAG: tetratricopeptide repeat protein [Polyangiales bacterium]
MGAQPGTAKPETPKPGTAAAKPETPKPDAVKPGTVKPEATSTEASVSGDQPASATSGDAAQAGAAGSSGQASQSAASGDAGEEVPLPSFLDTTDRRLKDARKPPSARQLSALRELEREYDNFSRTSRAYRDTVSSLVKREYHQRRRSRNEAYSRQIRSEERMEARERDNAIREFERFIRRYPDDPKYTPDAMFRLGELYFERSQVEFQQQDVSSNAESVLSSPDYGPTVDIYRQLIQRFPSYRHVDGAYYLIGYCLSEMGRFDEARLAWLNLVCSNYFRYDAESLAHLRAEQEDEENPDNKPLLERPALSLDGRKSGRPSAGEMTSYNDCTPVREGAEFLSETWFRIGELHFDDYGDPNALPLAISAYGMILRYPEDRNYNLALYKVAWAHYRSSNYPEAIRFFAKLVQWSDDKEKRTGQAGSELRPEALEYIAISLAYDDWNENQVADEFEGGTTGVAKVQDTRLVPQDRGWTPEVYYALGQIYFDEAKYPAAIKVWSMALERWKLHHRAPEIADMIARAYARDGRMEEAMQWRSKLADYAEGSEWWQANVDHPQEQRKAEQLAESAIIGAAIYQHQQAQSMRRRCVVEQDPELCSQAQRQYDLAAQAYRDYLDRYPNSPQAYELHFNLADAMYWSENYEGASREYASVRDSNLDDKYLPEAARGVVESVKRIYEQQQEAGGLSVREEAPKPSGTPLKVSRIRLPQLLERLGEARELYVARVAEERDKQRLRRAYYYNNTLLLYFYGFWPQARERFYEIFRERCKGAYADESGRVAWLNLRNMAIELKDTDEVERLGKEIKERQCTFNADPNAPVAVDCSDPNNKDEPQCLAGADLVNVRYRRAVDIFNQAEKAEGEEARKLYERASALLIRAVNDEPDHPEAPLALEKAAIALEKTQRYESAARLYQRIINEVGPRRGANEEEQGKLDAIMANAHFRLAYNANRFFDFDRAVGNYTVLADAQRFQRSEDAKIQEKREDALINSAIILERLGRYGRAASYYKRAASTTKDPDVRRQAYYSLAEIKYKQKDWNGTVKAMRDFIKRYGRDPKAGELVVQAHWRIAQARQKTGKRSDYDKALADVVQAYARSGQEPGSMAAEYAAQARFQLADRDMAKFEKFAIKVGKPRTMDAYVKTVVSQIDNGGNQAKKLAEGYASVPPYRRPKWTIAAFVRQGRVYEVLARAALNTPFAMPSDMQRQMRKLPVDQREDIRIQVEDRIRMALDEKVRPIECRAVARYALAARAAKAGNVDDEYTRVAIDRLQAYGDERIGECIADAQREDASFGAYQAGEFMRAPRGQGVRVEEGVAPPSLVTTKAAE